MQRFLHLLLVLCLSAFITTAYTQLEVPLVDKEATFETRALFYNLKNLSKTHIMFGHQDAMAYGVEWRDYHKCRTDVHDVCGKHPAVYGWDVSKLGKTGHNIDGVDFSNMQKWIKRAYKMGAVNTISWHMDNLLTGGNAWDAGEKVVTELLPGGSKHAAYQGQLDLFAEFVQGLRVGFIFTTHIPVVFRPFHEHTGHWFWWGQPHCTPDEFKELWRFTVSYLRDTKEMHNILYAYSPDIFTDQEHYLECYPGDEWVDVLGLDNYHDLSEKGRSEELIRRLGIVVGLADRKGKIAALTETGVESIPRADWWTTRLLNPIKGDPAASRIAWVLVWRNARPDHHFGPYPGHASVPDFLEFSNDSMMLFQDALPDLYDLE